MILFVKKFKHIGLAAAAFLFLIVLVWRYGQGGNQAFLTGYKPVNAQMQQLIEQSKEQSPGHTLSEKPSNTPSIAESDSKPANTPKAESKPANTSNAESKPDDTPKADFKSADKSKPGESIKPSDRIELNSATLEQLDTLPGIGESKARAILAYRQEKGSFTTLEQLLEIKGIGDKIFASLKPMVYIAQR